MPLHPKTRPEGRAGLLLAATFSGAGALVAEVIWLRYLHLIFGTSAYAIAMLMACFMLGLALGSWHVGRVADRLGLAPRALLVRIQIAIAAFMALSPLLYRAVAALAAMATRGGGESDLLEQIVRVGGSAVVLGIPTYLMGGTTPVFLKLLTPEARRAGREAGLYYAVNTMGAACGAFAAGFVLMPGIGLRSSLFLAAALNLAAAALVRWRAPVAAPLVAPETDERKGPQRGKSTAKPPPTPQAGAAPGGAKPALIVLAFGVSGFVGMGYEVAFARLLTFFFRDSVYDFTIVLTAFLCGAALGSAATPLVMRRLRAGLVTQLGIVLALVGLCGLAALLILNRFPYWLNELQTNTALVRDYGESYWTAGTMIRFGYTFLVLLVPSSLCGAAFPLVTTIVIDELPSLGRRVGLLSAANALGAAGGAVASGFLLANLMGLRATIIVPAALSVLTSAALLRPWPARAAVLGLALLLAVVPAWDRLRMSSSFLDPSQALEDLLALRFYREDAYGITGVVELLPFQRRYLVTNRLYAQNNSDMMGLEDHRRLGHIPMLLHRDPRLVLAVGLGAGVTVRGIADLGPSRIDCVEIMPAVVEAAAAHFRAENDGVLERPNVRVVRKDARGYLAGATERYDVIVLDILHPMSSGSSTVFSREYYDLCRQRLAAGGIVCQWLPMHQLTMPQLRTIAATLRSVFPHVSLWYGTIGELAVVGCVASSEPLAPDASRLAARYGDDDLVRRLEEVNLGSAALLLSHFVAGDDAVAAMAAGARADTDDRPLIEFAAPKIGVQPRRLGVENLLEISRLAHGGAPPGTGDINIPRLAAHLRAKRAIIEGLAAGLADDPGRQAQIYRDALAADPENPDLRYTFQSLNGRPD